MKAIILSLVLTASSFNVFALSDSKEDKKYLQLAVCAMTQQQLQIIDNTVDFFSVLTIVLEKDNVDNIDFKRGYYIGRAVSEIGVTAINMETSETKVSSNLWRSYGCSAGSKFFLGLNQ